MVIDMISQGFLDEIVHHDLSGDATGNHPQMAGPYLFGDKNHHSQMGLVFFWARKSGFLMLFADSPSWLYLAISGNYDEFQPDIARMPASWWNLDVDPRSASRITWLPRNFGCEIRHGVHHGLSQAYIFMWNVYV